MPSRARADVMCSESSIEFHLVFQREWKGEELARVTKKRKKRDGKTHKNGANMNRDERRRKQTIKREQKDRK